MRYLILALIALGGLVVGLITIKLISLLFRGTNKERINDEEHDEDEDYEEEDKPKKHKPIKHEPKQTDDANNKELLIRIITEDEDGNPVKESVIKADTDEMFANSDSAIIEINQDNGKKDEVVNHTVSTAHSTTYNSHAPIDIPINIIVNTQGLGEQVYTAAAQSGVPINVPVGVPNKSVINTRHAALNLFTLSRYDIFDHINDMSEYTTRFSIEPKIKEKSEEMLPDYLMCGDRTFALMYDKNDIVLSFILRLSPESAKRNQNYHPISVAPYPSGDDWYAVIIGRSFTGKKEVYRLIEESYDYTVSLFYSKEAESEEDLAAQLEQARLEQAQIEREAGEKEKELEQKLLDAEKEYKQALEQYKTTVYTGFSITRKEIGEDTRALGIANLEVIERYKSPQLPASLKYNDETYAMLYASDEGVIMVTQLSDEYAEELGKRHPEIRHAKFPKGPNWYVVPVDGAFENKDSVYRVLDYARAFVEEKRLMPKKPRVARKPTGNKPGRPKKVVVDVDPSNEEIVLEKVAATTSDDLTIKTTDVKKPKKDKKKIESKNAEVVESLDNEEYLMENSQISRSYVKEEVKITSVSTGSESDAVYAIAVDKHDPIDYSKLSAKEIKLLMKEQKKKEKQERRQGSWD